MLTSQGIMLLYPFTWSRACSHGAQALRVIIEKHKLHREKTENGCANQERKI